MVRARGKWAVDSDNDNVASDATLRLVSEPAAPLTPQELAAAQGGVLTRTQLRASLGADGVRRSIRSKDWQLVCRGVYAHREVREAARTDPRLQHRLDCAARILLSHRDLVVSHFSAALLHRLRLLDAYDGAAQLTLARPVGTRPAHVSGLLAAGLPLAHRETLDGVPVTTKPRTVADLARTLGRPAAVVMADAALRAGVARLEVLDVLATCGGWPGIQNAIDVVMFADRRAESALESLARVWFSEAGLPAPQLQVRLCHASDGLFVGRVDFFWPQHRTVCEVDGRVKYQDREDEPRTGVLWQEKLREDTMRDLGLEVARGYWSDGRSQGRSLVERVQRAFARAAVRQDAPTYGVLRSP